MPGALLHLILHEVGHGRRQWRSGEPWTPWIFKHGTNIVDRSLKVLFFGLFLLFSFFFHCPTTLEEAK